MGVAPGASRLVVAGLLALTPSCGRGVASGEVEATSDAGGESGSGSGSASGESGATTEAEAESETESESESQTGGCASNDDCELPTPYCEAGSCVDCSGTSQINCSEFHFPDDIYPIFQTQGCAGCHKNGGPNGPPGLDFDVGPVGVYEQLIAPGTTCSSPTPPDTDVSDNLVCVDEPEASLLIRTLAPAAGMEPEFHPFGVFPDLDNPSLQLLMMWMEAGALY